MINERIERTSMHDFSDANARSGSFILWLLIINWIIANWIHLKYILGIIIELFCYKNPLKYEKLHLKQQISEWISEIWMFSDCIWKCLWKRSFILGIVYMMGTLTTIPLTMHESFNSRNESIKIFTRYFHQAYVICLN